MVPDTALALSRNLSALLPLVALLTAGAAHAAADPATAARAASAEDARIEALFAADARQAEELDPLSVLYRGKKADPRVMAQVFTDTLDRKALAAAHQSLRALERIDRASLSAERQISYDVFNYGKREEAAWLRPDVRALTAVRPLNHFGGLQVEMPTLMARDGAVNYANEEDYRNALALDVAFAQVLDNAVARFREGMGTGVVETRLTVRNMIGQIDALLAQPIEQSPFYSPVLQFPDTIPETQRDKFRQAYAAAIRDRIYPAYRRLRTFLDQEYLPAARETVGLSAMKGGGELYRMLIERQTTLRLDPDAVHRLGLSEVNRIQREMDKVRHQLGHDGSLREFFDAIRTDPRFHPTSREQLARGFENAGRAVDSQIPRFFSRVPKAKLAIAPYPAYREKYEAGASYTQGSPDGSRPGTFFYNTYDLPSRFLSGMTTLYLHEGVPGHHFQISLAQEDARLPKFQRFDGNTAYVEGWALYAETLGYEMGLYKDPMQHWGTLDDEMLRAMRLVVDTGLHAKGWRREQAIDYMLANSGMGRTDAIAEVERYIANPGQALAYKIGGLTIQRLRRKAESALGERFDIRAFHEQVLGSGALPLPVLEAKIDRWIAATK
ncbi:MAG: DUF885 family protein [Novosphingobium sp.]